MLKALIVDDEMMVRVGVSASIHWEDYGYEIVGLCENGEQAAAAVERLSPDLVLTDIRMPVMDGLDLIRYIRQHKPSVHVVVLSCLEEIDYVKQAIKLGADDYVLKLSLTPEKLIELLEQMKETILKDRQSQSGEQSELERLAQRARDYRSLVEGRLFPQQKREVLERLGYQAQRPGSYLVCCCMVDDFDEKKSDNFILQYALNSVLQELLNDYPFTEVITINEAESLIVIRFSADNDILSETRAYMHRLNSALRTHLNISVSCGAADHFEDFSLFGEKYQRARELISFRFFVGRQALIFEKNVVNAGKKAPDKGLANTLRAALEHQDGDEVKLVIKNWFDNVKENSAYYLPQAVRVAVAGAWAYLSGYGMPEETMPQERDEVPDDYFLAFETAEYCEDLQAMFTRAVQELLNIITETQKMRPELLELISYLHSHMEENLSLTDAAQRCCLNRTYFCTLFKKEMGENYVEYVGKMKIEHAKQILNAPNSRVYEAAEAVGINDLSYFNKLFKKYCGVSPSQYKNGILRE